MNINQLYAFTNVYETGSFSESARILKLTQSAITQLIHGLEKDLDTLLFIRSKRPITPTENGVVYYEYAKKIINLHEEATSLLKSEDKHFTLSYRFTSEGIMDRYLFANPNERPKDITNISLDDFNSSSSWKENFLYFIRKDIIKSKNIYYLPAHESKVYAAVSLDSPLADKEVLTIEDLEGEKIILPKISSRTIVAQKVSNLLSSNSKIQIIEKDSSFDSSLRYVSLYHYVAFCTEEFARDFDRIKYIEFKTASPFEYGFACIGNPTQEMKIFIKSFIFWNSSRTH